MHKRIHRKQTLHFQKLMDGVETWSMIHYSLAGRVELLVLTYFEHLFRPGDNNRERNDKRSYMSGK